MEEKKKLDGKTWIKYSLSIWNDIEKTFDEKELNHPAMFPIQLVNRLLECYTLNIKDEKIIVLDPFVGSGSTLLSAKLYNFLGIGFDVVKDYINLAYNRLSSDLFYKSKIEIVNSPKVLEFNNIDFFLVNDDARNMKNYLKSESISIMITSPPYWKVHKRKRSADYKKERPYSDLYEDLGNIDDYKEFLLQLTKVFENVYYVLKKNRFAIINVMDLREGSNFIPFHLDIIELMKSIGFSLEDIIIWNRAKEYNNIRPLGYPYKFIINKIHEYLLIFLKK